MNFLGPCDDFVVSGSDDGNWFMWDKLTGKTVGIYEGDSSIVNVVEGHPYLPLVACSGLDHTVKVCSFFRFRNFIHLRRVTAVCTYTGPEQILQDSQ